MIEVIDYDTGETIEISLEEFEKQKQDILVLWQNASQNKAKFVAQEKEMRERFVLLTGDQSKTKGTEYVPLPNQWSCKITKNLNYTFRKDFDSNKINIDAVVDALSEIAAKCENGPMYVKDLIKWKPELSIGEYNKLTDEAKNIIDEVIVTSPGSPSLEIIPPKEKPL